MLVQEILKSKANDRVFTLPPGTSVGAAAEMLSANRIGAVIVSPDGRKVAGILSERDIVRELGRAGPDCLDAKVDAVMTRAIYGCAPTDTADSVLETMTNRRFRHMPVMEGNVMVGFMQLSKCSAPQDSSLVVGFVHQQARPPDRQPAGILFALCRQTGRLNPIVDFHAR